MNTQTTWRKSSYSGAQNECVELAVGRDVTDLRDTKNRDGGTLRFGADAFRLFVTGVKAGRFDPR